MWLLLMSTVLLSYCIQRYRFTSLPPSSCALLLGVVAGGASRALGLAKPLRFSPGAFFYGLLPPIVFAAGFTLKKKARAGPGRGPGGGLCRNEGGRSGCVAGPHRCRAGPPLPSPLPACAPPAPSPPAPLATAPYCRTSSKTSGPF